MIATQPKFISLVCVFIALGCYRVHAAEQSVKLSDLSAEVVVDMDDHGIPHVFASSWTDAARVLGYLHASERLWQMDMLRRRASGATAEILGEQGLESDILMRRLGTRRTCVALWNDGNLPAAIRAELEAYAAGVNARIAELGEHGLPPMFAALGYQPAPWTASDGELFVRSESYLYCIAEPSS